MGVGEHHQGPEEVPTPATQRSRRWLFAIVAVIVVVLAAVAVRSTGWLGLWAADSSTRPLAREFADLDLGGQFKLEFEDSTGSSACLLGDCLRLDRYYVSDLSVTDACRAARAAFTDWGDVTLVPSSAPDGDVCDFGGTRNGYQVIAQVRSDMTIESPNIIGVRDIDEPHNSVLFIELVDAAS